LKPAPFLYEAPDQLDAVLASLASHGDDAKLLAGGQSLVPVLNFRLARPARLIDLNRVGGLDHLGLAADGTLRLGAMTRQRRLERDTAVARHAPLLAEAMPWVAHPQIRNRGTLGGSLVHADPAAELPAVALALDARFRLVRSGGERWVEARDFFTGLFATALATDELLAEVALPPQPAGGWAFQEVARRHGDYAQVGLAALLALDERGLVARARLVFLAVGEGPLDATATAAALVGQPPTAETFAAAAEVAGAEIEPSDDIQATAEFKRHLARALTRRTLAIAAERAARATQGGAR
jgi:CO/xanthine dehydrogenase FAD-binding subunit